MECHMDPTITKASTDNERLVTACAESQSTSSGPNRTRFLAVQAVIRVKMRCDKKVLIADADASKKRNLLLVAGHADNPVEVCGHITWTYSNMDIYQYIRNIFCASPHSLSVSPICTQTHRDTGMKSAYVTDRLAIQFKTVRRLIMSEDFWDTLKLATLVLKPALVALRYCDGMKGGTVSLLYNLLLELDKYYSKPIKGLDEAMRKKMHNVFTPPMFS